MSTSEKERRLEELTTALRTGGTPPEGSEQVVDSARVADAIVIGGGGNLNSQGEHHLFDRVALARIARATETPLFVTSQTVGPALNDRESELVAEIADTAVCFGVREPTSGELMRRLAPGSTIVETVDDAALLTPGSLLGLDGQFPNGLPPRYVVGSFTVHAGSTGFSQDEYVMHLASLLDAIVWANNVDVVLIPHLGKFAPAKPANDQLLNASVIAASRSGRIVATPMIDARTTLAITEGALFTVSTRYHPVVFGTALGVPGFGLELSQYSAVRMRGALGNYGLSDLALSQDHLLEPTRLVEATLSLEARRSTYNAHVAYAKRVRRNEQLAWWQAIVDAINGSTWVQPPVGQEVGTWELA